MLLLAEVRQLEQPQAEVPVVAIAPVGWLQLAAHTDLQEIVQQVERRAYAKLDRLSIGAQRHGVQAGTGIEEIEKLLCARFTSGSIPENPPEHRNRAQRVVARGRRTGSDLFALFGCSRRAERSGDGGRTHALPERRVALSRR